MRKFDYRKYEYKMWDSEILGLVAQIHEYKGRQEQFLHQRPLQSDRGYAYEVSHAFFDYLFSEKGARRIYAYTEDYNIPSQRLCEKLGMRREGLFLEFVSFEGKKMEQILRK